MGWWACRQRDPPASLQPGQARERTPPRQRRLGVLPNKRSVDLGGQLAKKPRLREGRKHSRRIRRIHEGFEANRGYLWSATLLHRGDRTTKRIGDGDRARVGHVVRLRNLRLT